MSYGLLLEPQITQKTLLTDSLDSRYTCTTAINLAFSRSGFCTFAHCY